MTQFVGFLVGGYNPERTVAIAAGTDRQEVFKIAMARARECKIQEGGIQVKTRDDIDETKFAKLQTYLDESFAKDLALHKARV